MSKSNTIFCKEADFLHELVKGVPTNYHMILEACNDFVLPATWGFRDRINTNFHLAYVRKGHGGMYTFNGQEEEMRTGKVFLIGKGCCHSRIVDPKTLPRIALVRFSVVNHVTGQPIALSFEKGAFAYTTQNTIRLNALFELLFDYQKNRNTSVANQLCGLTLAQILLEIHQELRGAGRQKPIDQRVRRVATYIEEQVTQKYPLEILEQISGLSSNYLRRLFYQTYGMNLKRFHIEKKVEYAMQLLLETELKVKDIADMLGYEDQFSFSKQFKQVTQSSPSNFRKIRVNMPTIHQKDF